jgi:hypothetical protein
MKYLIATLALLICFQADISAQRRHSKHRRTHHRTHRSHHRVHREKTYYRTHNGPVQQPSAYKGDNTPINDGQKKNKNRNMNYNSGQPLPSSSGR